MARPRRKTELFGFMCTVPEARVFRDLLKQRRLTATEYLRAQALQPVLEEAQQPEGAADDPSAA
jgi:hypothetical protein